MNAEVPGHRFRKYYKSCERERVSSGNSGNLFNTFAMREKSGDWSRFINRQLGIRGDGETDGETDRQTDRQTDREGDRDTQRDRERSHLQV